MASGGSPAAIPLRNLVQDFSRSEDDLEAQHERPTGVNAQDRRYTFASNDTAETLTRQPTWQVEEEALHGYPKLANLIGNSANYAIYRGYKALNARNLLYQQAKIAYLERELNDLEKMYEAHTHLHYKVEHLFRIQEPGSSGQKLRMKHEEIASELQKYNHMLLEQAQIHKLETPDATFVDSLWNIINSSKTPAWMEHPENAAYAVDDETRKPVQQDLVTLNRAFRQQDPSTRFFTGSVVTWWYWVYSKFKQPDDDLGFYVFGDNAVYRYIRAIVMIAAAALPTCSIVALYFIEVPEWRLGFIVLFSGLFAAALSFFTEANSIEVFTASVALASVQVVFVGTAFGNNGSSNLT